MPIPENPITREEQYLDGIATGSTEGIPPAPLTRTEQYLDAIARNGGGGGSSLPAVTAEDNGDVLTVVEGAWAKAAPSGSSGVLVVEATYEFDEENGEVITLHETAGTVFSALETGPVYIRYTDTDGLGYFFMVDSYVHMEEATDFGSAGYYIQYDKAGANSFLYAETADDYPTTYSGNAE